jgi:hypothetical protein
MVKLEKEMTNEEFLETIQIVLDGLSEKGGIKQVSVEELLEFMRGLKESKTKNTKMYGGYGGNINNDDVALFEARFGVDVERMSREYNIYQMVRFLGYEPDLLCDKILFAIKLAAIACSIIITSLGREFVLASILVFLSSPVAWFLNQIPVIGPMYNDLISGVITFAVELAKMVWNDYFGTRTEMPEQDIPAIILGMELWRTPIPSLLYQNLVVNPIACVLKFAVPSCERWCRLSGGKYIRTKNKKSRKSKSRKSRSRKSRSRIRK